jgi:zinc transport system substrate-binding protein
MMRIVLILLLLLATGGCSRHEAKAPAAGKLPVVATIFPVYDFVRAVGGERVDVSLLLPPGAEPHSFEPKPADMVRVAQARLFVFTSPAMEPWATKLLTGASGSVQAVDASRGITLRPAAPTTGHDDHDHASVDPHLWLDFAHARRMVGTIADALIAADPAGKAVYAANAAAYDRKLQDLDDRFRTGLANCRSQTLLQGGHAAFGYLANRYHLQSRAAMGVAANAEPTPRQVAELVTVLQQLPVRTVFSEELVSPRLADTLAKETGATVLRLNAGHTVSRNELQGGVSLISLMDKNLATLREGLACQ